MSELRQQLLILESAVAVARATAEPTAADDPDARVLLRAAALMRAVEAILAWVESSEQLTLGMPYPGGLQGWLSHKRGSSGASALGNVRESAELAVARFDELGVPRPNELMAKTILNAIFAVGGTAEELALSVDTARRKVREVEQGDYSAKEVEHAKKLASKQAIRARREIQRNVGDITAIRHAAIGLLPKLAYAPGEDLPILRIKQESPLEVVVILIGSAGALVAVLNGLLDVQVKYKTRKEKEQAERSRLERELLEDEAKAEAIKKLRMTFSRNEPERLKMQEFAVFDSLEEAFEDDEEMKAT